MGKLNWRLRLLALVTLVLSASLLFQVFYVIPYLRNREVERTQLHQEEIARNIARELDIDLMRIRDRLEKLARLPEFGKMNTVSLRETLVQHEQVRELITSLFVMDARGWFTSGTVEDLSAYTTKAYADQPYFRVPFERGEACFTLHDFSSQAGLVSILIAVPIESDAGEREGVLVGTMTLNPMIERVANYPLKEGTVAYIVDREATVVAHSEIDLFALEEGPLSLNYSELPIVQAARAGETGGAQEYERDGRSYFGSYAILQSNGWAVVVDASMSSVLAESDALGRMLLWMNGAVFAITFAVTLAFVRQIAAERMRAEELARGEERSRRLARQIVSAQEEERQRISRELHDELGQALTALKIHLQLIQDAVPSESESLRQQVGEARDLTDATAERMRRLARDLRPPALDNVGLDATLEGLCHSFAKRSRLSIDYLGIEAQALPDTTSISLYRFLQEALTNVAKHANAEHVQVELHCTDDTVSLSVEDDGRGFERQPDESASGIGLLGIRERLHSLGGRLEIESWPSQGARLVAHVPAKEAI